MRARTAQRLTKIEQRLKQLECSHSFSSLATRSWPDLWGPGTITFEEKCNNCGKVMEQLSEKEYYRRKMNQASPRKGGVRVSS